jgi:hypothetical protein
VKFGGFNQKPITVGLLKRGLGGISSLGQDNKITIGENQATSTHSLTASMKGDMFHGKAKVSRPITVSFSTAEAQQRIGNSARAINGVMIFKI